MVIKPGQAGAKQVSNHKHRAEYATGSRFKDRMVQGWEVGRLKPRNFQTLRIWYFGLSNCLLEKAQKE